MLSMSRCAAAIVAAHVASQAAAGPLADDPSMPAAGTGMLIISTTNEVEKINTVAAARRYLGGNPTGRRSLWCADFITLVEREVGRRGTGSRLARSYLGYGRPVPLAEARAGDIVVLWRGRPRGRSGHVGYLTGRAGGRVELISGNVAGRVRMATYPAARVLGVRRP